MKSSELSNDENRIALRQLLQNRKLRHLWRHNLGSRWKLQKMARENFSNVDNPIKTVGRDSFLSPKTPKIQVFQGSPSLQGSHSPYILGDTTRSRHITYVLVWSKSDQRRLRKTRSAQTNKQTDKPTDTTKIMVTWPRTNYKRCWPDLVSIIYRGSSLLLRAVSPRRSTMYICIPAARLHARLILVTFITISRYY